MSDPVVSQFQDDLVLNGAISQQDRTAGAPKPETVPVDGRSLADLLGFAADYGRLIRFYDIDNHTDSDWSVFFLQDDSIRLALLAGLDIGDIEAEFDHRLAAMRAATGLSARLALVDAAVTVLLRLVHILADGGTLPASLGDGLGVLAASSRRDLLAAPAQRLAAHLGNQTPAERLAGDLSAIGGGWYESFVDFLDEVVAVLMTALAQGRADAVAALEPSFHTGTHAPQSGLYDAFAKLFRHAQTSINRVPARLLDFYAADVLRQTSRAGTPDQLFLTFTPARGIDHNDLPKHLAFDAGKDTDGAEIVYALDTAMTVAAATITSIAMVTQTSAPPAVGAKAAPAQVYASSVALATKPPIIASPVPLFGGILPGSTGPMVTGLARMGFAIASPTLWMTGGLRTVTLGLTVSTDSWGRLTPTLTAIATASGLAPATVLATLLGTGFALSYSTAGGWAAIAPAGVTVTATNDLEYRLGFTLDADADPFVALATAPAAAATTPPIAPVPDATSPTLLALLIQSPVIVGASIDDPAAGIAVYPYAILAELALAAVTIAVSVDGLSNLNVTVSGARVETTSRSWPLVRRRCRDRHWRSAAAKCLPSR